MSDVPGMPPPPPGGQFPPPGGEGYQPPPAYGMPPQYGYAPQMGGGAPLSAFGRPLAEWWKRLVAIIIDGIIVGIIGTIIAVILGLGFFTRYLLIDLVGFVYYGYLNGSAKGQTVGKMAMSIQVRNENGGPLGVGPALLRYAVVFVLSLLCGIPALIDGLWPLWDKRRQAWHDKVVKSVVVDA